MARFHWYCPVAFEEWDFRNPDTIGIGGSETCVVEMARRLASRGHEVTVYGKVPDDCPGVDSGGAMWLSLDATDFSAPGIWVLSRCPSALDHFAADHPAQKTWLVCQDVFYPPQLADGLTPERSAKLDICLPLCTAQEKYLLKLSPELNGKMRLSSNGIRPDLIGQIEADGMPERDPFRIVYTSSPDRGLAALLRIFKRAREFEPRLTLRAAYGFDNIDKCKGKQWIRIKAECERLMDQPGVTWLGRMPQPRIYHEFLSAGLWVYPTTFTETSCCTCMEAQACGAIPITNPLWALEDNVRHGSFLPGDPNDPLVEARYVGEILRWTRDLEMQERCRVEMMPWARKRFDWERVVDQYERLAHPIQSAQYAFQLQHAFGNILNIGCSNDAPGFGQRGGVNLDLHQTDVGTGFRCPIHVQADARAPLPFAPGSFDSVVLGDILEHMTDDDAVMTIRNAKSVLDRHGKIVITCPEDHRGAPPEADKVFYAAGVNGFHERPITLDTIGRWLDRAGLKAERVEMIHYGFATGHGVVACS